MSQTRMTSTDAICALSRVLDFEGLGVEQDGNATFFYAEDRPLSVTELGDWEIRLSTPLPDLPQQDPARLLEAGFLGAETGSAQIALDDLGRLVLVEVLHLAGMSGENLQCALIDFMSHAEFWRSEGLGLLAQAEPGLSDEIVFRV